MRMWSVNRGNCDQVKWLLCLRIEKLKEIKKRILGKVRLQLSSTDTKAKATRLRRDTPKDADLITQMPLSL